MAARTRKTATPADRGTAEDRADRLAEDTPADKAARKDARAYDAAGNVRPADPRFLPSGGLSAEDRAAVKADTEAREAAEADARQVEADNLARVRANVERTAQQ